MNAFIVALIVGGGVTAGLVLLLPYRERLSHSRLATLVDGATSTEAPPPNFGAFDAEFRAHLLLSKLRWLGLQPEAGRESAQLRTLCWSSALLLALVGLVTQLPLLVIPILAAIGYWLPGQLARTEWARLRLSVDGDLLTLIGDLSGMVNFTTDPVEILNKVALNQAAGGQNFLAQELQRTSNAVRLHGQGAWEEAEKRATALSPTLAMIYFILRRLKQTGGTEFARAFRLTADNLTEIISTRQLIQSKAQAAKSTMYLIAGIFAFILLQMLWNPTMRQTYTSPLGQLILAGCLGVMGVGFGYIFHHVEEILG